MFPTLYSIVTVIVSCYYICIVDYSDIIILLLLVKVVLCSSVILSFLCMISCIVIVDSYCVYDIEDIED